MLLDARSDPARWKARWRSFRAARVTQPVRTVLEVGADRAYFGLMPAALDDPPAVGAKLVTVYERNHERGLPSHLATIVLLDHETGALSALLDGRYITEARTAAVSAVSVKHLARPDARVLAIIGIRRAGAQPPRSDPPRARPRRDVRVWSPNARPSRRVRAAAPSRPTGLPVRAVASPAEAVRGADLIVLATSSRTPVVDAADVARRRAHRGRGRVPPRPARDADGAHRAGARLRGLARRAR